MLRNGETPPSNFWRTTSRLTQFKASLATQEPLFPKKIHGLEKSNLDLQTNLETSYRSSWMSLVFALPVAVDYRIVVEYGPYS